jgi:2-phospho-L-lactate guanylyltransferase
MDEHQHHQHTGIDWWLLVPVKGGGGAKSRLVPPAGAERRSLSRAFALDTIAAAVGAVEPGRVLVVTGSDWLTRALADWPLEVLADPKGGLNAAVAAGLTRLGESSATSGARARGVAVLLGDLPAVRAGDIRAALGAAGGHPRAVVPDRHGQGTVLLTALSPLAPLPSFGRGSAARHTELGHSRLDLDAPRLRTDVDDSADLAAALALGVGPRTTAALRARRG